MFFLWTLSKSETPEVLLLYLVAESYSISSVLLAFMRLCLVAFGPYTDVQGEKRLCNRNSFVHIEQCQKYLNVEMCSLNKCYHT